MILYRGGFVSTMFEKHGGDGKCGAMCAKKISRHAHRPNFDHRDREDLFPDSDPAIPLIALAFGEHDVITELLNMELETAGQVELEPCPIFKMDGTDPGSIRRAFRCARVALDTLEAASLLLSLGPGFEPFTKHNPFGG
jgi:hypothetical protein